MLRVELTRSPHGRRMTAVYADRTLRTVINLGRYGELFAYAQTFSYENPE
jgi:NitT/TauT family transport system ATP-binding protein